MSIKSRPVCGEYHYKTVESMFGEGIHTLPFPFSLSYTIIHNSRMKFKGFGKLFYRVKKLGLKNDYKTVTKQKKFFKNRFFFHISVLC